MNRDLHQNRENYSKYWLEDNKILENPLILFDQWYKTAEQDEKILEPNAMNLATSAESVPRTRIVLLKAFSENGFLFYTNYQSRKGKAIAANPEVCLHFFWPNLERQVIINGRAEKLSPKESDAYFYSRPLDSQIGAIISDQSAEIPSRDFLEQKFDSFKEDNKEAVRPEHWGGYRVIPYEYEFWQGRPNRLHDRIYYSQSKTNTWKWSRLSP